MRTHYATIRRLYCLVPQFQPDQDDFLLAYNRLDENESDECDYSMLVRCQALAEDMDFKFPPDRHYELRDQEIASVFEFAADWILVTLQPSTDVKILH